MRAPQAALQAGQQHLKLLQALAQGGWIKRKSQRARARALIGGSDRPLQIEAKSIYHTAQCPSKLLLRPESCFVDKTGGRARQKQKQKEEAAAAVAKKWRPHEWLRSPPLPSDGSEMHETTLIIGGGGGGAATYGKDHH